MDPASFSELTVTGSIYGGVVSFDVPATGDQNEQSIPVDTGTTSGVITVNYDFYSIPDRLTVYYPPCGQPGSTQLLDSGSITGAGTFNIPYGPV